MDEKFFLRPRANWQKRYEALRASLVERLPADVVARKFGFETSYVYFLRYQFKNDLINFDEPPQPGKIVRRRVNKEVRQKIIKGKGTIEAGEKEIIVTYPRRSHNPILRKIAWQSLPNRVSWLGERKLNYRFL